MNLLGVIGEPTKPLLTPAFVSSPCRVGGRLLFARNETNNRMADEYNSQAHKIDKMFNLCKIDT